MRVDRRAGLIALLLCAAPSAAEAADEARVAIVPLLVVNASEARIDGLTATIAAGMQSNLHRPVLGGRAVRRRLPEAGVAPDCPADPACVQDLLTALEADALVFCVITSVGDQLQVDPSVYQAGRTEPRPAVRASWAAARAPDLWSETTAGWIRGAAPPPPPAPDRGPSWPVWTAAGVGAVALGVGIGFGVSAGAGADDLEARGCEARRCEDADIDAVGRRARIADVSYVIAGVAAATAVGLYYVLDVAGEPVAVTASPGGLGVTGRF